jgi:OOP family OmpA-OmpF porin
MNKIIMKAIVLSFLITISVYPQLSRDSWSFGFGVTYPRMMSLSPGAYAGIGNYGGYLNLQRNFSEHVGIRLLGNYSYMKSVYGSVTQTNNLFATDLDLLYYFVPCEDLSPYLAIGFGGILFRPDNSPEGYLDVTYYEYQFNLGLGAEWHFSEDWGLRGEGIYHTPSTNKLDGYDNPGPDKGLFGGNSDTYITLSAGLQFYFSKGEPSNLCDLYDGVTVGAPSYNDCPSLEEIEELIKKYACKEVVVEKPVMVERSQWVLVGVNFEFNSSKVTPESYPILYGAVQYLNQHPDIKVEIQGHTDNIGTDAYNQQLSERRATAVRDYLVAKGIDPKRLIVKGYGESVPIADNNTEEGRTLNRRIEFKVIE